VTAGLAAADTGIENGALLIALAEAIVADDKAALAAARQRVIEVMGVAAFVDAAGVAAYFNGIDRIADATGTPLDPASAEATAEMRAELGIDRFYEVKRALDREQG
jgi:hypothetical protein